MQRKSQEILIQKTSICPAGAMVLQMVDEKGADEFVRIKVTIGTEKVNGFFPVYVDWVAKENLFGLIKTKLEDSFMEELAKSGNYEVHVKSRNGNAMTADLIELLPDGTAPKDDKVKMDKDIAAEVKRIVDSGLVSQEEMDERIKVFNQNKVDKVLILRVLKRYRKYNKPAHRPSCIYQDPYMAKRKRSEGVIAEGLRAAVSKNAVICEGDKSVGKNVYVETIAWLLNMPMYLITFTRQMSPASIYGEKTTDGTAAKALADFDSSILMKADVVEEKRKLILNTLIKAKVDPRDALIHADAAMSEEDREVLKKAAEFRKLQAQSASVNIVIDQSELYDWLVDGGVMTFNELNMAEPNFFASFTNQLLDGTGFIFIPGRGEVKIHKDCVLFGTQNAEYAGTEMQNEATMSRFGCIVFPQPESVKDLLVVATEAKIKAGDVKDAKLDDKYYEDCQRFYAQCLASVHNNSVTRACLNIRGFVRALQTVAESGGYAKLRRQIEINVVNTCPADDRVSLIAILDQTVTL